MKEMSKVTIWKCLTYTWSLQNSAIHHVRRLGSLILLEVNVYIFLIKFLAPFLPAKLNWKSFLKHVTRAHLYIFNTF